MEKEIRVYDLLDSLGIDYQRVDHEAAMTMEACGEIDQALSKGVENEVEICKNLFLCNRQATEFYLLLIPGDKPFKTKYLSAQIGSSRLSFAKPEAMQEYLDITPGSVSVMGLMNDRDKRVQLLIDGDVPLVKTKDGEKPLSIAIDELNSGKITIIAEDSEE